MNEEESNTNILAALGSTAIAGLGQFMQGRKMMGAVQFILWIGLWMFMAGWTVTIWSVIDAAVY